MENTIEYYKKPIVLDKESAEWLVEENILKDNGFVVNENPTLEDCMGRAVYGRIISINRVPAYNLLNSLAVVAVEDTDLHLFELNLN